MPEFNYTPPLNFNKSVFGGNIPAENYRVKTLLIILGLGVMQKKNDSKKLNLQYSYLTVPYQRSTKLKIDDIASNFSMVSRRELEAFFKNNLSKNIQFHKNIYDELLSAIGYLENSNPIVCFLYIYRLIEQIALCLPMVSLIDKSSFQFTFNEYKKLIENTAKSDLSVLKKYSENILDPSIGDVPIKFDFTNTSNPLQNVNLIIDFIPQKIRPIVVVANSSTSVEIKLKHIHIFIISFRNEYFHYLFHEKNINFSTLEYPEEFLSICNPIYLNYFSHLYLDLLKSEISIWG